MAKPWPDDIKQQALELLAGERTFYEVRDATGVPVGTLHRWAEAAGLEHSDEKTRAANERRRDRLAAKREAIAEQFLDRVEDLMGRMDEPHVVGYLKNGEAVVHDQGASADCKNYMTAAAIALDKFRLEMGEVTSRTETRGTEAAQAARQKVDELAERRRSKSA